MRIAHIATVDISLRFLLLGLLRDLQSRGYDVSGISARGNEVRILETAGIRHIPVPMTRRVTPLQDLRCLGVLTRFLRKERFHIVNTHTPKGNLLGQWAALFAGIPVRVSSVHGLYFQPETPCFKRQFWRFVETISAIPAHVVVFENRDDAQTAERLRICPPRKIRYLRGGMGVNVERFDRSRVDRSPMLRKRAELGFSGSNRIVGFVGRLVREKGVLDLFSAARVVREQFPDARFLFVGPVDRDKPDAVDPAVAASYGISDVCCFAGLREDLPELLAMMEVFVLPSYREGLGIAVMEACAMEVPCIVTDIRGPREVVEHGRNGLVVRAGSPDELAGAISMILSRPEEARRMGKEGRRMAVEFFDERIGFEFINAEYQRQLAHKGLKPPARSTSEVENMAESDQ